MSQYLGRLARAVKALKPDCLMSMAPAPMPHGMNDLMQESLHWLRAGLVDWLHPQIYRNHAAAYGRDLRIMLAHWTDDQRLALGGGMIFHYGLLAETRHLTRRVWRR